MLGGMRIRKIKLLCRTLFPSEKNMRQCRVDLVAMDHPGDVSAIAALFDRGEIAPENVVAILGKDRGQWLRQRFHPRLCGHRPKGFVRGSAGPEPRGGRRPGLDDHVRRHRGRAVAASWSSR